MKRWNLISVLVFVLSLAVLVFVLSFVLSLVFGSAAFAQRGEVEIDGLIIDQTQTRIGQEFYQNFVTFWEAPLGVEDYNILIIEMANPTWGSWIWIEVGGFVSKEIVYREMLKPSSEEIEEAAKRAVGSVKEYLYRLEEYEKEVTEKDMTGTGIY